MLSGQSAQGPGARWGEPFPCCAERQVVCAEGPRSCVCARFFGWAAGEEQSHAPYADRRQPS